MKFFKPKEGTVFRLLPPWCDEGPEQPFVLFREFNIEVCASESKFGFGCPMCEALMDQYPEDRGEGGIE